MSNDAHRGDSYKPALMTMAEIAPLYEVEVTRIRSARKHIVKHPKPVVKIGRTDYFHTHAIYDYIANNDPLQDIRAYELRMRRGYLANVKRHSKKRVVRKTTRTVALQSFNVALAW